jgi:hypothetical protein
MKVKILHLYSFMTYIYILGHVKGRHGQNTKSYCFYIKMLNKNPNKAEKRHQDPPKEMLSSFRENVAYWSKMLALIGLLHHATHANTAQSASQDIQ